MSNTSSKKRVAIIGAGVSGLVAIKSCLEEDLEPVCFESTSDLGGLWHFTETPEDDKACVMRSTVINTSKEMMAYSDFPPPKEFANYMHNTKVMEYMWLYVKHFGLEKYIHYKRKVTRIQRATDYAVTGRWLVMYKYVTNAGEDTEECKSEEFDAVLVATGHHGTPYKPEFPGLSSFPGLVIHSHDLRDASHPNYKDKRILIVGIGNSGGDLAVALGYVSRQVFLSTRRGTWILHRVGDNGMPGDSTLLVRAFNSVSKIVGPGVTNYVMRRACSSRFDHAAYGLRPTFEPLQAHPMVNDDLPNRILCGAVQVRDDVKRFFTPPGGSKCTSVEFVDGSVEHDLDVAVLATGYTFGFPFLEQEAFKTEKNQMPLYKFVFPPHLPHATLAFIGYIQPWGAIQPLAELQTRWCARVFKNLTTLPPREMMERHIEATLKAMRERYVASQRHTIQVDWIDYMDQLAEEVGCRPPVTSVVEWLRDPRLMMRIVFDSCTPYQYRIWGPHPWPGARDAIMSQWERIRAPLATRAVRKNTAGGSTVWILLVMLTVALLIPIWCFK